MTVQPRVRPRGGGSGSRATSGLALLGPAFVAGVAYVDPGNVATNTAAGSTFGYLLVWVVVLANAMAVLVQYLAAKLAVVTGQTLPRLCRERYGRRSLVLLWPQAVAVAVATDLAEILGGALALHLLFGMPLAAGGCIVAIGALVLLSVQQHASQRRFEASIVLLLCVVVVGFGYTCLASSPDAVAATRGLAPRLDGTESLLLVTGMLGATVMPHAIYLHGALVRDRFFADGRHEPERTAVLLSATRADVLAALVVAGAVNLALLLAAAATLDGQGIETIQGAFDGYSASLGTVAATLFAIGLLASGIASSSVGTYAGAVINEGFVGRAVPLVVWRCVTLMPALAILLTGIDPTSALVWSQVILSFGIPFALLPLIRLTSDERTMGQHSNRRSTTCLGWIVAITISLLNTILVGLTLAT